MLQLNKLYERRLLIMEQLFEKRFTKKGVPENSVDDSDEKLALGYLEVIL